MSMSGSEKQSGSELLKEQTVLEGPFWPERVKIISVRKIGTGFEIHASV
ncbi:MAG: hypothetical protein QXZ17_10340 [Nitrososphaerota archaeon]